MDNAFDAEMNPGKNPVTDIWTYRTFKDDIAATGHEICQYLGSHIYDETAQQFKLIGVRLEKSCAIGAPSLEPQADRQR